ncbi:sphingomyelin phosphodiesterase-like isoform X3 [Oratosquilla oratoria]|uniref:sphingomyelin phosphodiesterase-like isoform X3 n=1 Tax=Oratosquilla oratoria TaxID=337810 RepID=UPI003F75AAAF
MSSCSWGATASPLLLMRSCTGRHVYTAAPVDSCQIIRSVKKNATMGSMFWISQSSFWSWLVCRRRCKTPWGKVSWITLLAILAVAAGSPVSSGNSPVDEDDRSLHSRSVVKEPSIATASEDEALRIINIDTKYDWGEPIGDMEFSPTTEEEKKKIEKFDPSKLNYTALRIEIDTQLQEVNKRTAKLLGNYRLPKFLSSVESMFDFDLLVKEIETSIMSSVSCNACKAGVGLLQHYVETGKTRDDIIRAASKLCTSLKIETPRVCFGIIHLMADEVVYVVQKLILTPDEICGFVIGDVCGIPYNPYHEWRVAFPPVAKPPVRPPKPPQEGQPTIKVLHLSDTHFDPDYAEGSNADCGEPLCCRRTSGHAPSLDKAAGLWGDYRKCDTPLRTINSMLENIAYLHPDIDYIIWTGDLPPHDVWNQTRESNLHILEETVQQLVNHFPYTPIFPALGNHESAPVNSFPPPFVGGDYGVGWLYEELNRHWLRWLPADTSPTVLKGGFYSVLVSPGFRIISLNMNYCNNKNWWLLLNSTDPAQELQWFIYELQGAELRGEKVHVLGHIPPGHHDCLKVWSHNYYTIINRFENTITAQFFGHTHFDEYEIFYDEYQRQRVTNIAYIGPSVTSYYGLNPGYRIYTIEGEYEGSQKLVVDHETWIMNLDEANRYGTPRWYRLYSAKRAYNMHSLLPVEWDYLVHRMAQDDALFRQYYRYYWKNSPVKEECDKECKKRLLCDLKSGRSNDRKVTCAKVKERVEAQERTDWKNWIFSGITVTWSGDTKHDRFNLPVWELISELWHLLPYEH